MTATDPGPQRSAEAHSAAAPYAGDDAFTGGAHGGAGWPEARLESGDAVTAPLVSNVLCALLGCGPANAVRSGETGQARVSHGQYVVETAAALTAAKLLGVVGGVVGREAGAAARGAVVASIEGLGPASAKGGVYALIDDATGAIMRTGRTNNLTRRAAEHAQDARPNQYKFRAVYRTDQYAEQRGLEQLLHVEHSPPLNNIGGINPRNPATDDYVNSAIDFISRWGDR